MVWNKLEEQNPQFFQLYYTSIKLKDQIVAFNYLVGQQVRMNFDLIRTCDCGCVASPLSFYTRASVQCWLFQSDNIRIRQNSMSHVGIL